MIKTKFLCHEIPKQNMHYTCIACLTSDSVMTSLFRRMQIQTKENKSDQIYRHWIRVRVRVRVRIWHESESKSELEPDIA